MARTYDAALSRQRLLKAAQELFSERGFEATTTRQIAELAEVDAALIARYFGSKEKLYIAAVALDGPVDRRPDEGTGAGMTAEGVASWLLRRTELTGPGPVMQALVRSDTAPEIRQVASDQLHQLFLDPLTAEFTAAGASEPQLFAEIVVFTTLGWVIGRAQPGSSLAKADHDQLVRMLTVALTAATGS